VIGTMEHACGNIGNTPGHRHSQVTALGNRKKVLYVA
jgi:hypothetical protein